MPAYDELAGVLGLLEPAASLDDIADQVAALAVSVGLDAVGDAASLVTALIVFRVRARADRDWEAADAIRDGLATAGIEVRDTADGAEWLIADG